MWAGPFRAGVALIVAAALSATMHGQAGWAKPAFAGQTNAPKPSQPSAPFTVQTVTNRLSGPWSIAFLPDGTFLVTEANGTLRIVRAEGVVSAPIAGVPGVKSVAAQGLHDLLLDPEFATNRTLYFTYFAPPKGEAPAVWPIEFFYERVWTKPLAERRTMQIGMETVARAKLSRDGLSLSDVETIAEAPNAGLSSRATARCSSPGPIDSVSTIPISTASITTSLTTRTSGATSPVACCASTATGRFRKTTRGSVARPSPRPPTRTACAIRKARRSIRRRASCG